MGLVILVVAGKGGLRVLGRRRLCDEWRPLVLANTRGRVDGMGCLACVARDDRIFSPDLASDLMKPNPSSVQPVLSHLVRADGGGWGGGEIGGNP